MGDSPQSGRKLGRYQIVKHLASGGMAQVMLARASGIEGFERHVVIKQIHVERARDPNVVKMFVDEARLAALLHHTNIVQVHDIGQDKGEYFFAMEYLHGEDLRVLLTKLSAKGETLPLEHVITIIMAAASALHHAHEQRGQDREPLHLVHRDVSPANIFVCYDGNVKVVDFGIAKAAHRSTETHSGTLKGKISYMAPEQCMGLEVDRRSDVFALGIVLYELYTVRRLFKAASEFLTMTAIVAGNIPKPSLHRREIPPDLEAIIMRALAAAPADRFQTADEMRIALDRLAVKLNLRTSISALADYMAAKFGRRPEPWLADDNNDDEIAILDVDFDGSANGIVTVCADEMPTGMPTPLPGSLMATARDRTKTAPVKHKITPASPMTAWDPSDEVPTTASGTPMAWVPGGPMPKAPRSRRWPLGVGAIGLLAVGGFYLATRSPEASQQIAPASIPTPTPTAPPVPERVAPPPAPTPAPAPEPPPEPTREPTIAVPAVADPPPRPVIVRKKPPPKKPDKAAAKTEPKPTDADYDPDTLFIKKKP